MSSKPVIGVPSDRRILGPHPFHMAGEKYLEALIHGADAIPMVLPALGDDLEAVAARLDGVLLTGSPSNVDPAHYDGPASRDPDKHDPARDALTLPLARFALEHGLPLLAICRGFQELNVALGGSLHQYLHEVPGYRDHRENPDDPVDRQYAPAHAVSIAEGGMLQHMVGVATAEVNSLHSQGVDRLADGVTVEAHADDGLVEAFSVDGADFALALQWHPEWRVRENPLSMKVFAAFGSACRNYSRKRNR